IGSVRGQLVNQFLTESFLVVLFSFVLALSLVIAVIPWFNELADKNMDVPWTIPYFWLISLIFILITSLVAGSYPALYLSSFNPLKALKGSFSPDRAASIPRKVLVVVQFTVSIILIIGTIVVWQQIQFAKNRPIGYTREGLIMIRKNAPEFWGKFNALRNELKASGAVVEMAESSSPVTESWFNNSTGFNWPGKDPNRRDDFATVAVTHEYGKTMGWNFILGRDYSREFSTDSSAVILNEAAVRYMGLTDPIDEEITWNGKKFKVIGVIKDVIMDSPYTSAKQTVFSLNYEGNVWINIRMNPEMSSSEALTKIEKVFQALVPSVPFDFKFTEVEFANKFAAEERIGMLSNVFSILAILISCLGLFGMASFVAARRKKEVGVRKILGASSLQLWKMLSTEFVLLVGISCSIGIPIAVYFLNQWLSRYEYRTALSVWVILITVAGTVAITLLTVSFQTIRAALVNPVNSLRSE
ncbi:MAG TPA: FtsX-like permease family protein, partial [Cyclobacteriaceae bacterium]|nr:FtsX-like permease family protein [Cyclobacteriaceae bacterium]